MATKAKTKVKRLAVSLPASGRRDPLAVPAKLKQPGLAYRWAAVGPGADPADLDVRVEELEERGFTVVTDPAKGGPVRRGRAVLMAIPQALYDRGQRAKVEANMAANRAQAQQTADSFRRRLKGQGRVVGQGLETLPAEALLSENETFIPPE